MNRKKSKKRIRLSQVKIEHLGAEGKGIARVDGQVVFVNNTAPGDLVNVEVRRKKKSFLEAEITELLEPGEARVEPYCMHFNDCGGCKWQHVSYEAQLQEKQLQVENALQKIAKVPLSHLKPILPSPKLKGYRNKLEFTFSAKRWFTREEIESKENLNPHGLGFHVKGYFDKVIHIEECHHQVDPANAIRLAIHDYAQEHAIPYFDLVAQKGYLRNLILRNSLGGEWMLILQVFEDRPEILDPLMAFIQDKFPEIQSLNYVINPKKNDTFQDLEVINVAGPPYITEKMEGLSFRIGPKSFFQTNPEQALSLYRVAREMAQLSGNEVVYDLYTGTGTIANFVAQGARKVIGLEYVPEAIEDAKVNSEINGIDHTRFFAGDIKDLLSKEFFERESYPDVIITDPPRAGMHEAVCEAILNSGAKRIVYVSCNPATQARDIAILSARYEVQDIQPVDMFPQTPHVENVVLLCLKP